MSGKSGKGAKKAMFKKCTSAPKRFKSAFMIYSVHRQKQIRNELDENEKLRTTDISKMVSKSWKLLDKAGRAKWEGLARQDRERYEREKAAYKGPWKVPNVKFRDGPRKPMSAFLAFGNERRKEIAANNPLLSNAEISSLLSKLWRECPADIKQAYRDREAHEREVFKKERAEWERKKHREAGIDLFVDSDHGSDSQSSYASDDKKMSSKKDMKSVTMSHEFFRSGRSGASANSDDKGSTDSAMTKNVDGDPIFLPQLLRQSRQSIEEYSLDSLLSDEELFEDFSPEDVPQTVPFINGPYPILPGTMPFF